jgi:hypothetical protein
MSRSARIRFWIAILTVALLVVLRPLAQASPADPVWIAGLYDGADFDDVVSFLVTDSGLDTTRPTIQPAPRTPDPIAEAGDRSVDGAAGPSSLTRAPPLPFAPPV